MPIVKVTKGTHYRKEEGRLIRYGRDERLEVSDREYEAFKDKFAIVSSKEAPKKESDEDGKGEPGEFDVETADIEALRAKAKELEIDVGPRWGERRLRDAIIEVLEEGEEG